MPTFRDTFGKLNLEPPLFYGISDRRAFPDLAPAGYLELLFQTRAHVIQWREKDLTPEQNRPLIRRGAELARETGKLFVVNSRVREALGAGAGGAHLTTRQDLPAALRLRRQRQAGGFLVGKSVHSFREAEQAETEGADYLLLGPVFDPVSKDATRPALGLAGFREVVQALYTPVFALGGIVPSNFERIVKAGAAGVAGISWLKDEVSGLL